MPDNTCVCCGKIIPEGRQICLSCEGQNEMQTFGGVVNAAAVAKLAEDIRDIVMERYNGEERIQFHDAVKINAYLDSIEKEVEGRKSR